MSAGPLAIAQEVARLMWADDRASQALGMQLLEVRPGYARISMTVRRDMTNGHGMCHGGFMFLLADSTFAFACNSHNQKAVAASAEIHFLAPAQEGDVLTAEGQEQHLAGRSGVYDTRVTDQSGKLVALFRGKSATIKGQFIETSTTAHSQSNPHHGDGA
ncbi:MAG: hydroxyphenylacetyl-CoA thioesterase PaaI [Burkholderiales bacterium]|jgi:acyl-CoA thioesterase|nr:hydroxyphenylacetyl-CoA thioesterase PaaI [Burkholderiales bacterium]